MRLKWAVGSTNSQNAAANPPCAATLGFPVGNYMSADTTSRWLRIPPRRSFCLCGVKSSVHSVA
jgi:hypothetical protein